MSVLDLYQSLDYGPAPESTEPASEWIARHDATFGVFIDGHWQTPESAEYFDVLNPGTGQILARAAQSGGGDVDAAVRAALSAFPAWRETPGHVRARYLYSLARQVQRHSRLFATLESLDNGKPIRESRDIDIPLVARHFYYHAGWAQLMASEFPGHEPVGIIGQIIPWNFPLLMLAWKIAPALATGNTVVLKPAEFTPLTALLFAEIVQHSGLPSGVVNVITGDGRTGEMLVQHPDVNKIAFTGSTEVGRIIRRKTAGSGKRLSLELGGKSPFVVFDDADLDSVVEGLVDAIWFNQGQVCCAGSRLLVQENVEARLLEKVRRRMETLRLGHPLDKAVDLGAIVAPVQLERIETLVAQGVAEGASVWQPSWACPQEGYFYPPTLLTNVSPASTVAQVEIFGPVLVSMTFRTPQEAVALANNTRYGLAASIWSENVNTALDIASQIRAGTIWINSTNLFDASSGFGGYRESGYGREGGREGLFEYLKLRRPAALPTPTRERKRSRTNSSTAADFPIDRTPKLYIGGKQTRPDSGYSRRVYDLDGRVLGEVGEGNRKDIRNAVEAARRTFSSWSVTPGHNRAQILYYLAENLSTRADEFARSLAAARGESSAGAQSEVQSSITRLFTYAAWADKFNGRVQGTPFRMLTIGLNEPIGVMGILCPEEAPLLGLISLLAPAVAMGNTVVAVPSPTFPLAATDFYQVLDTSDVPAGVINIVTGERDALAAVLAEHDDVDAVWYFGATEGMHAVEYASAGNMKRTWTHATGSWDWEDVRAGEGEEFLRESTQVKNIWAPYGA